MQRYPENESSRLISEGKQKPLEGMASANFFKDLVKVEQSHAAQ
jgi:hypothetical protein